MTKPRTAVALLLASASSATVLNLAAAEGARPPRLLASTPEIIKACQEAKPGDELVVKAGTYEDVYISFRASGTAEKRILLRGEEGGKVILKGKSRIHLVGDYITVKDLSFIKNDLIGLGGAIRFYGNHNRVTGCYFHDIKMHKRSPEDYASGAVIQFYRSATRNRFDHNHLEWNENLTYYIHIQVSPDHPNYAQIDHNYIGYQRRVYEGRGFGKDGYVTLQPGMSNEATFNSRTVVEYNLFDNCEGIVSMIDNKSCENVYRYNTFRDIEGGITLRGGKRCIVEGNYFFLDGNKRSWGIRIFDSGHRVVNNYIYGSHTNLAVIDIHVGQTETTAPDDLVVANNTIVNATAPAVALHLLPQKGLDPDKMPFPEKERTIIANNLIVSDRVQKSAAVGSLFRALPVGDQEKYMTWIGNVAWESGPGVQPYPKGVTTTVDPQLQLDDDGIWRPAPGSPVIGKSKPYPYVAVRSLPGVKDSEFNPDVDIDGRPRGNRRDVGCDQASGAGGPRLRRPLTKQDVGPAWMKDQ